MRILVLYIRSDKPDLSNMQIVVLLIVYMTPGPHGIPDLALQLGAPRSAILRALGRLASLGYVLQEQGAKGRRKTIIVPTDKGTAFLEDLKQSIAHVRGAANDDEPR
ncbi:MAG: MarR family transcriptional regulator [Sphingomonadales bacterium]|nr:MAG: MarR family transcriptional regulator [Sphingomonadales bacterium]